MESIFSTYPNKRLRGYSARGNSRSGLKIGRNEISRMSEKEYEDFRTGIKSEILRRGRNDSSVKHLKEILRKVALARKSGSLPIRLSPKRFVKQDSILLDALYPERNKENQWKPYRQRKGKATQIDLNALSFIDKPEEAFDKLRELAFAECHSREACLNFRDSMCLDMSPYLVIGLLKDKLPPWLLKKGKITKSMTKILGSVGLLEMMKIVPRPEPIFIKAPTNQNKGEIIWSSEEVLDSDEIMPFSLRGGGGHDAQELATSKQRDEKVANEFVDTLKDWIGHHNPEQIITPEMSADIKEVMTEMFDNALRHGDPKNEHGRWHTVGVLQKVDHDGRSVVVCNLAILNLGRSISESLKDAPPEVLKDVDGYVKKHNSIHSKDTLRTVAALQDKISRIHPTIEEGNATLNGVGLMTAIMNVFNPLFSSNVPEYQPSFTVLSGNAWISARHPYNKSKGHYGERTLAFNEQNDIEIPPDAEFVKTLKNHFPGTIISIRFVIGANQIPILSKGTEL